MEEIVAVPISEIEKLSAKVPPVFRWSRKRQIKAYSKKAKRSMKRNKELGAFEGYGADPNQQKVPLTNPRSKGVAGYVAAGLLGGGVAGVGAGAMFGRKDYDYMYKTSSARARGVRRVVKKAGKGIEKIREYFQRINPDVQNITGSVHRIKSQVSGIAKRVSPQQTSDAEKLLRSRTGILSSDQDFLTQHWKRTRGYAGSHEKFSHFFDIDFTPEFEKNSMAARAARAAGAGVAGAAKTVKKRIPFLKRLKRVPRKIEKRIKGVSKYFTENEESIRGTIGEAGKFVESFRQFFPNTAKAVQGGATAAPKMDFGRYKKYLPVAASVPVGFAGGYVAHKAATE